MLMGRVGNWLLLALAVTVIGGGTAWWRDRDTRLRREGALREQLRATQGQRRADSARVDSVLRDLAAARAAAEEADIKLRGAAQGWQAARSLARELRPQVARGEWGERGGPGKQHHSSAVAQAARDSSRGADATRTRDSLAALPAVQLAGLLESARDSLALLGRYAGGLEAAGDSLDRACSVVQTTCAAARAVAESTAAAYQAQVGTLRRQVALLTEQRRALPGTGRRTLRDLTWLAVGAGGGYLLGRLHEDAERPTSPTTALGARSRAAGRPTVRLQLGVPF
jgi:hypothetical protein